MKIIKHFLGIKGILTFILFALISTASAQDKYAVLISAGVTQQDDRMYHSEYWYDLFLMYQMLIENGFTHNDIYVLYGNGNDFNSAHPDYQTASVFPGIGQITDYRNRQFDVEMIFRWLADGNAAEGIPQIQPGDFLFYWWMGHGSGCDCADYQAKIENTGEYISDDEFAAYFDLLPACTIKSNFVMTCRSGGLIDDLEGLHTMIHTAAECCTGALSRIYDVPHAELSYHVANAFREQEPDGSHVNSDDDNDGLISVKEVNDYAHDNTTSNTQIGDFRNIAPLIYIAHVQPDADVPNVGVYSRDYAEDNGTEPSEYMLYTWYEGPDLWVRHADDGETEYEEPEFGETNYMYARIHNIGCALLNEVNVDLSWCEVSAWANPASWNPITTVTVNNLESSESRIISEPWSDVPVPGKYCLHTVLNAPGDPANTDGRAFMDNNKVQINVTVEDNVWGWKKKFRWLIENGLDKKAKVDVVIDKLKVPASAKLTLGIPRDLKFDRLTGGDIKLSAEGKIIEIAPKVRKTTLQGVMLAPREKKEVVLSVVTPREMRLGESLIVKVSEQIKGKEMGGIVFNTRTASQKQVMSTLFRRVGNLFKVLGKKFKVSEAKEISKLCQEFQRDCRVDDPKSLRWAMTEVTRLESKIKGDLSKLMGREEFVKFETALQTTRMAVKKENIALFAESQEEMIFSTKPLFLQKMRLKSLKK